VCVSVCFCDRSLCSLVCKWLYEADGSKHGWNKEFLCNIGLADLAVDNFQKIGMIGTYTHTRLTALCLGLPR